MVANKVKGGCAAPTPGIRRRPSWGRRHNDANVMAIGQRMISEYIALELVSIFLNTAFEGGRHIARIKEIE